MSQLPQTHKWNIATNTPALDTQEKETEKKFPGWIFQMNVYFNYNQKKHISKWRVFIVSVALNSYNKYNKYQHE